MPPSKSGEVQETFICVVLTSELLVLLVNVVLTSELLVLLVNVVFRYGQIAKHIC